MSNLISFTVVSFLLVSCASFKKKDPNKFVGPGSADISSQDIDSDSKGSDSGIITGLSTVYFSYDQSTLSEKTKQMLLANIRWIRSKSDVRSVELEGHCDSMGSESYNIGLGRRRAEAVKNFLIENGISASKLSAVSYGEEQPISSVNFSKNRRVNFVPIY